MVAAPPEAVFDYVDNPLNLASHMRQASWRMAGSAMTIALDARQGKAVGAPIRMSGTMLGLHLSLDEVVTEREPPRYKTWETVGEVKLLILAGYRMGVLVRPMQANSLITIFIDYDLPTRGMGRLLGAWCSGWYARWCVRQMITAVSRAFGNAGTDGAAPA